MLARGVIKTSATFHAKDITLEITFTLLSDILIVFIKLIQDSFPVLSNEVGNHIVDFKFETENSNPASIEMSFKSFQFREGNGQQRITCKIMTCEGKCGQGKVTIRLTHPLWITHGPYHMGHIN